MGKLPDVYSKRPVARPSRAIATVSPKVVAAPGRALEGIGGTITQFGEILAEREASALATERDNQVSADIRDALYNPESGFVAKNGRNAVDDRAAIIKRLDGIKSNALKDLGEPAKRKLEASLNRRINAAMGTVERHTLGERDRWLSTVSSARRENAFQDALADPASTQANMLVVTNELTAQAAREGWGGEKLNLEVRKAKSNLVSLQVTQMGVDDPSGALEYAEKHADDLLPEQLFKIRTVLSPKASRQQGEELGKAAYQRWSGPPEGFEWKNHIIHGGTRPDAISGLNKDFRTSISHMIAGAPDEIRSGLQVFSGYRSVEKQQQLWGNALRKYGSAAAARKWVAPPGRSQHNHGRAADLMWNGQRLDKAPAHVRQWVHENASRFGLHFPLSNEAWHVEQAGTRSTEPFKPPEGGLASIIDDTDPVRRDAAIAAFQREQRLDLAVNEVESAELGVAVTTGVAGQEDLDAARDEGVISPTRWETLTEQLIAQQESARKEGEVLTGALARLEEGDDFNGFDTDDRNAIKVVDERIVEVVGDDPEKLEATRMQVLSQSKVIPPAMVASIRQQIHERDPAGFVAAMRVQDMAPTALSAATNGNEIQEAMERYKTYVHSGIAAERAAQLAMPTAEERRAQNFVADDVRKEMKDISVDVLADELDTWIPLDRPDIPPAMEGMMMADFETLYSVARADGMDPETARSHAARMLVDPVNGLYGESSFASGRFKNRRRGADIGADSGLMRHPPERYYPAIDGGHEYIENDIKESLSGLEGYEGGDWFLMPDDNETEAAVKQLRGGADILPGYKLVYSDSDGALQFKYWSMDPVDVRDKQIAESEARQQGFTQERERLEEFMQMMEDDDLPGRDFRLPSTTELESQN